MKHEQIRQSSSAESWPKVNSQVFFIHVSTSADPCSGSSSGSYIPMEASSCQQLLDQPLRLRNNLEHAFGDCRHRRSSQTLNEAVAKQQTPFFHAWIWQVQAVGYGLGHMLGPAVSLPGPNLRACATL